MPSFDQDLQKIRETRTEIERANKELYQSKLKKQKKPEDGNLASEWSALNEKYTRASSELDKALKELYLRNGYKNLVGNMSAEIPVVFLPLRIETRFVNANGGSELWVRIYPDDIHVHTHEALLTDEEYVAGRQYWLNLLKANKENVSVEDIKKAAWKLFVEGRGAHRGLWVAKQTMPLNWTADLNLGDGELQFPPVGETKSHAWTQAPRTQLLPDQFVVNIYRSGRLVHAAVGSQVPDTVFLGPDPLQAKDSFEKQDNSIILDDSFAWITDFEKAVEKGLGLKITLQDAFLDHGMIERIIVMGVCSSASPQEGKVLFEQMIENHQYSTKGFSFLPQRSSTNNTENSGSAYSKNENYFPKGYYEGEDLNSLNDPEEEGSLFAKLLGIDKSVLKNANHASKKHTSEALAMNKALYSATIGPFMENLAKPLLTTAVQTKLRDFFAGFVTSSGPLSAIRIGDQPYSLLITSDMDRWADKDPFFQEMVYVLKRLQSIWNELADRHVAHVGRGGDPSETLIDILGLEAGSVSFIQRLAHLPDFSLSATNVIGAAGDMARKQKNIHDFLKTLHSTSAGMEVAPFITNMHYYKTEYRIDPIKIIDGKLPAIDRFLDKLGPESLNYIEWLANVSKEEEISAHSLGASPPRSILYLLLRYGLLRELEKASKEYYNKFEVYAVSGLEMSVLNISKEYKDLTNWELIKGTPSKVDAKVFNVDIPLGDYFLTKGWKDVRTLNEFKGALKVLSGLPTLKLQHHLTDHIDLCSYRLDAWQMGLFNRRLQENRLKQAEGVYYASYGCVEKLRSSPGRVVEVPEVLKPANQGPVYRNPANAGFIHTPSLNHATAAGLLLAGYQNHAKRNDPGAFALNLSSERVRRAILVIQGIQNNQRLEALLGYQFERALHDLTTANPVNNLNQYILSLREKFPLESAPIPQAGTEAQESVPAYSVVDGLKIVNTSVTDLQSIISNEAHKELVLKEKNKLEDTLDAINDLLIAETAFQATQGKTDRTAAVLNAMKTADLPPDLEFHKTPRSTHLSFTNRVTMHFDPKAPQQAAENWTSESSPRSMMEAGLNQWLGITIGDPSRIISGVSTIDSAGNESAVTIITLAELNLQPIDFVYLLGTDQQSGIKDLETYIERAYRSSGISVDGSLRITFDLSGSADQRSFAKSIPLIRSLRLLINNSRAASAKDFASRPKTAEEQKKFLSNWDKEELTNRVSAAYNSLQTELTNIDGLSLPVGEDLTEEADSLGELFRKYFESGASIEKLEGRSLTEDTINLLQEFLRVGQRFGLKTSSLMISNPASRREMDDLLVLSASHWRQLYQKLTVAGKKMSEALEESAPDLKITRLKEAAKALLGDDFVILPQFKFINAADVEKVIGDDGNQLLKYMTKLSHTSTDLEVETWLESVSRVRPYMAALEQVRMIAEVQSNTELKFVAAQFPFVEKDSWLAVEFPPIDEKTGEKFDILDDTIVMAIQGDQARNVEELQSALLVDEWTEAIPNEKEISGISFNYDQPNASAPNVILVAVEPTGAAKWGWDTLLGIVNNTLDRAKTRAVEPSHILGDAALDTLLPMTVANFDLRDANISLDYLTVNDHFIKTMLNMNLELYKAWK